MISHRNIKDRGEVFKADDKKKLCRQENSSWKATESCNNMGGIGNTGHLVLLEKGGYVIWKTRGGRSGL